MFGKGKRIKISDGLYSKLEKASSLQGCSSLDEFAERVLENEADRLLAAQEQPEMSQEEVENIANKLKGLGYLE